MSKKRTITGVVSYQTFATGFWGITDRDGNDWRPVHMPDQLKIKGATVKCTIREIDDEVSIFMWGKPVKIVGFETPGPVKG